MAVTIRNGACLAWGTKLKDANKLWMAVFKPAFEVLVNKQTNAIKQIPITSQKPIDTLREHHRFSSQTGPRQAVTLDVLIYRLRFSSFL